MSFVAAIIAWFMSFFVDANAEAARCAAAVHVAAASLRVEQPRTPDPKPRPKTCQNCNGTGWVVHGDGYKTRCQCGVPVK